jgi:hypothetical protein
MPIASRAQADQDPLHADADVDVEFRFLQVLDEALATTSGSARLPEFDEEVNL